MTRAGMDKTNRLSLFRNHNSNMPNSLASAAATSEEQQIAFLNLWNWNLHSQQALPLGCMWQFYAKSTVHDQSKATAIKSAGSCPTASVPIPFELFGKSHQTIRECFPLQSNQNLLVNFF